MTKAQYLRSGGLLVFEGDAPFQGDLPLGDFDRRGIDLSEMRFTFDVMNADAQSPNNATIKVYNLSTQTVKRLRATQYARVVLRAGYQGLDGIIFSGDIKQFQDGRESATDTFLTIFAGDGDIGFNFGFLSKSLPAGSNAANHIKEARQAMGFGELYVPALAESAPGLARGKAMFGMARDLMRTAADSIRSTWSVQNGKVQVIPLDSYLPREAVVLNAQTGMLGVPQQTDQGISVRTLINPRIEVGALVRLNNKDITQRVQADGSAYGVPFNQWAGIQFNAKIADDSDGLYRVYVCEHHGDTRGGPWYSDLICLAISPAQNLVSATR